jgi:ADP-ribosyl-[dinitrogen reductase] hydrolase
METKTSESSPIQVVKVVPSNRSSGWVGITFAPGKKTRGTHNFWNRDLDTDLDRLKKLGVTTLTPFLENDELERLQIPDLVEAAQTRGMCVRRFPFHDVGVPEKIEDAVRFIREVARLFQKGERVLMHCNGGLGRAGTMAACVRLALGLDAGPNEAIAMVRRLRSRRAIETKEQEGFVARFQKVWADSSK